MKVCKIIDEARDRLLIGYLLYFERGRVFSVELSEDLTLADSPIFFDHFIGAGQWTVDPLWRERWVSSRVVPTDRQNLGMILRDNKLKEYDLYKLLMLGSGRCAQDDCAVIPTDMSAAHEWLHRRRSRKLDFAMITGGRDILSIFRDGTIWRTDPVAEGIADERLRLTLEDPQRAEQMMMIPGGLGVQWQPEVMLTAEQLYGKGDRLPFTHDELDRLLKYYVMLTSDVCEELGCSRQYVDKKVRERSLATVRDRGNTRLYTASDVARFTEQ